MIKKQTRKQIKILRIGNGLEFFLDQFGVFCRSKCIIRHNTIFYTLKQNVVAERMNRTTMETVYCMLSNSKISKSFWARAVSTSYFLINQSLVAINKKTSIEVWLDTLTNCYNLKILVLLLMLALIMGNQILEMLNVSFLATRVVLKDASGGVLILVRPLLVEMLFCMKLLYEEIFPLMILVIQVDRNQYCRWTYHLEQSLHQAQLFSLFQTSRIVLVLLNHHHHHHLHHNTILLEAE